MKRPAFAQLCGVSKMMISKYGELIVLDSSGDVDVMASLANLEGRLDETKRQKALLLATQGGIGMPTATAGVSPVARPAQTSAKIQKDEIERDLKRLEYGQKAGELVHVADVAEVARQAVAAMRETFNNSRRDIAKDLCVKFDLPADRESALARFLSEKFETALGRFGQVAATLAKEPDFVAPAAVVEAAPAASQASLPV